MSVRALTTWQVFRPLTDDDGLGGQTVTMQQIGTERGDVRELVGRELIEAMQAGAEHTHNGRFRLRADIRRNDELRRGELVLQVLSVAPSMPPARMLVLARAMEAGN